MGNPLPINEGTGWPKAHLDSEVMKRHFPSPSIILTIHLLLFLPLSLNRIFCTELQL